MPLTGKNSLNILTQKTVRLPDIFVELKYKGKTSLKMKTASNITRTKPQKSITTGKNILYISVLKKKENKKCANYWTIILTPHLNKTR